jgi:tripartite-type tricarboxylate transporter receptor subunit TctC
MKATAKALLGLALSATCLLSAPGAMAQAYPSKPIRMIVPFPAGGTTDIVARIVAQRMSESMGQPVTVDNRGGAGGAIGADVVAKAAPDGYTIMMHNLTFPLSSVAQTLAKRSPFNPETDFAGVAIAVYVPFVWTAHPGVPAKDLRELGNLLRANPNLQYNYGSTGPGSDDARAGRGLQARRQGADGARALQGRRAAQAGAADRPHPGRRRPAVVVAGRDQGRLAEGAGHHGVQAHPRLPDVPTVRELGLPNLELEGWNGVFAPAKTPKDVLDRLQREVVAAVKHPDVVKRLADLGAEGVGSTAPSRTPSSAARWTSSAPSSAT